MLSNSRGVPIICILFLDRARFGIRDFKYWKSFPSNLKFRNFEMGTNGKEISCERFPKNPEEKTKSAKRTIQTKIPLRRKFNFKTIISGKKFPKIWITSQDCPRALSIGLKFPKSWYGNFRRKFPENPEIVEIPRSEPGVQPKLLEIPG